MNIAWKQYDFVVQYLPAYGPVEIRGAEGNRTSGVKTRYIKRMQSWLTMGLSLDGREDEPIIKIEKEEGILAKYTVVDQETCIACGAAAPEIFDYNDGESHSSSWMKMKEPQKSRKIYLMTWMMHWKAAQQSPSRWNRRRLTY